MSDCLKIPGILRGSRRAHTHRPAPSPMKRSACPGHADRRGTARPAADAAALLRTVPT